MNPYDYFSCDGNAYNVSDEKLHEWQRIEDGKICCECHTRVHPEHILQHTASGEYVCMDCKDTFIASLCDGDEISPKFIPV